MSKNKLKSNKSNKSNSIQQSKQKQFRKVESGICEKCDSQCVEYNKYVKRLAIGKFGLGTLTVDNNL